MAVAITRALPQLGRCSGGEVKLAAASGGDPRRVANRRTALVLAIVVAVFFVGIMLKYLYLR